MRPRPDVHAVEQPEVAVAHCLERPKQSQTRGYADPREHLFDEAGRPEFIVLRSHSIFFYIVGHQPIHTKGQRQQFQVPWLFLKNTRVLGSESFWKWRGSWHGGYYPAQGLDCHSPRASRRIPVLFFHAQKVALIESMNPQWQDLSEE
jgi:hypothetical protein